MTRPLSILGFLFVLVLLSATATVLLDAGRWLLLGEIGSAAAIGVLLMLLALQALRDAVVESERVLSKTQGVPKLKITNLKVLSSNHKEISKKFERSAELIANLSNPEKSQSLNDLDADDAIGGAIQMIRAEMERVKAEEHKRNWITQGLAKFGEVLRTKAEMKQYGSNIIGELVKYIGVSQGGIYIEAKDEDGDRCLDLLACYAYDKQRFSESRIGLGSGLLGQCMIDQELVFITDIPRGYAKITSGLGEATPRNVVIAPLMFNGEFYGAVELVAFDPLEPYQVEFLREVSQSIAAEVATLKSVVHTEQLLSESNILADRLQNREHELKLHLETISATQLEMSRKQAELTGTIGAIDGTLATANFSTAGRLLNANAIFLKVLGYDEKAVDGKTIQFFTGDDPSINLMWENLRLGKFFSGEFKMRDHAGKEMWLTGTFNPIVVEGDVPDRILMLAQFTTQEKDKLNELTGMVLALKATFPVLEFNADFSCKTANDKAMKLFNLSRLQLRSKRATDFISPCFQEQWNKLQRDIVQAECTQTAIPLALPDNAAIFECSLSVSRGLDGTIIRIILILIKRVEDKVSMVA